MPSIICPGCARRIDLPEEDMALEAITCVRCERLFTPSDHLAAGASPASATPQTTAAGLIVAVFIVLVVGGATMLLLLGPGHERSAPKAVEDPYAPDCAIVRAWLKERYGDVEVVSWGQRIISRSAAADDSATLSVRFRLKGERHVRSGLFVIGPGDMIISAQIRE